MKPKADVLFTMAQLYREKLPELPTAFAEHWEGVVRGILGPYVDLRIYNVHTSSEFSAAVKQAEDRAVDRLIILPMAYAPSGAATVLVDTNLPLVIVSTARDYTLPASMDGTHLLANQGMHGTIDLCNYLNRCGRIYGFVAGHPQQKEFRTNFRALIGCGPLHLPEPSTATNAPQSAKAENNKKLSDAIAVLKHGRIGRIGEPFDGMMDLSFDSENQKTNLGFNVIALKAEQLTEKALQYTADQTDIFIEQLDGFTIDTDVSRAELEASSRLALALDELTTEQQLDGLTVNFMSLTSTCAETMPFLGASRLMANGMGYAGEGDVLAAMLGAALHRLSGESTFTELYSPDYQRNELFLSHMGECNYALAHNDYPKRLRANPFKWGNCLRPVVPVFQLKPGETTLVSLSETADARSFQLLAFEATVTTCEEHSNLTVPYSRVSIGRPLADFLSEYVAAGGTHHAVLSYNLKVDDVAALATECELEYRVIETGV